MNFNDLPKGLGESVWEFPAKEKWPRHDVVGRGADLQPETLIYAYRHGVFPMVSSDLKDPTSNLLWWSPQMRAIIPLNGLVTTRSMRRSARKFEIRVDTNFEHVMRNCAAPHRDNGWITEEFIEAYLRLHQLGWAHSIEVIDENGFLAGGLYGVRIGGLFAGESMFHLVRDASKVACSG
jgi:leucyl/phenylalanyl-tRNA--protein transferase